MKNMSKMLALALAFAGANLYAAQMRQGTVFGGVGDNGVGKPAAPRGAQTAGRAGNMPQTVQKVYIPEQTAIPAQKMGHQGENPTAMTNLSPLEQTLTSLLQAVNKAFELEPVATKLSTDAHQKFAELQGAIANALTGLSNHLASLAASNPTQLKNLQTKISGATIQNLKKAVENTARIGIITPKTQVITTLAKPGTRKETAARTAPLANLQTTAIADLTPVEKNKRDQDIKKASEANWNAIIDTMNKAAK